MKMFSKLAPVFICSALSSLGHRTDLLLVVTPEHESGFDLLSTRASRASSSVRLSHMFVFLLFGF